MVKLHVKWRNENQFLFETSVNTEINSLLEEIVAIYNGRLKINRISVAMEQLAKYGVSELSARQTLTEQIEELNINDEKYIPNGGFIEMKDPSGIRSGKAPNEKMSEVILKAVNEAKVRISENQIEADVPLRSEDIQHILSILHGACAFVYPMGLPHNDPIQQEFDNKENLREILDKPELLNVRNTELWWAGKQLQCSKKIADYVGKNEKTKIVVKLQKVGLGVPPRETSMSEEQKQQLMIQLHKRQEELKSLEDDDDDSYLNSSWADNQMLKKSFQGLNNIKWKPH